jgi:hypothetical protein
MEISIAVFTATPPLSGPSAGFLLAGESLLDLAGIARQGIAGLEHRKPAPPAPNPYGVDATSTPVQRHGWDIHAL